jgi:hypothetical protein
MFVVVALEDILVVLFVAVVGVAIDGVAPESIPRTDSDMDSDPSPPIALN